MEAAHAIRELSKQTSHFSTFFFNISHTQTHFPWRKTRSILQTKVLCRNIMSTGFMKFHGKEKKVHAITVSDGTYTKGWGCLGAAPPPHPPKFKKHRFCIHSEIKSSTWFILHPKSAAQIGCWTIHWIVLKTEHKTLDVSRNYKTMIRPSDFK